MEVLRSAFANYFVQPGWVFNKSLFHYLLSRLGAARDATYANEVIALFRLHPEEFDEIADYCSAVGAEESLEESFLRLQRDGLLPYAYLT